VIDLASLAAVAVVVGGLIAVSGRDVRVVAAGLLLAVAATPLVASPLPDPLPLAAWLLGGVLAAYLIWAAARVNGLTSSGSAIGPLAETAAAATAFIVGVRILPVLQQPAPPDATAAVAAQFAATAQAAVAAQAAGLALIVVALVPLIGRDVLRIGIGIVLLTLSLTLLTNAWVEELSPLANYAMAVLVVGVAGAACALLGRTTSPEDDADEAAADDSADAARPAPQPLTAAVAGAPAPIAVPPPAARRKRSRGDGPKP
jgi:hypothetical protein